MPALGLWTALVMTRLHRLEMGNDTAGEAFLVISLVDMLAFAVLFGLAARWRRRPEHHRRLMLMASCGLTVAAFARFPHWLVPTDTWCLYVDGLIAAGVARDWMVMRRVHAVYVWGVPLLIAGQAIAMWTYLTRPPTWLAIAHAMLK